MAEDGVLDSARGLLVDLFTEDEPRFEVFQMAMRQLWIAQLGAEAQKLAMSNPQGESLERFKQLRARIQSLQSTALASGESA